MVKVSYFIFAKNHKFTISHGQATIIHVLVFRNQKTANLSRKSQYIPSYFDHCASSVYLLELIQILGNQPLIIKVINFLAPQVL